MTVDDPGKSHQLVPGRASRNWYLTRWLNHPSAPPGGDWHTSAGCELSSGLVSIELPARLRGDDCIQLGDKVVAHDRHVESAGHRVAAGRPELPRQVPQSAGLVDRTGYSENQSLHLRLQRFCLGF